MQFHLIYWCGNFVEKHSLVKLREIMIMYVVLLLVFLGGK